MNGSLIKKLQQLVLRLEEVEALLSDPSVVSYQEKYKKTLYRAFSINTGC